MEMNGAEISAIAALSGSALGGLTPIVSNYLVQRGLTEREMLDRELGARQSLYSEMTLLPSTHSLVAFAL
jgi:hypothetical protein